MKGGGLGGLGGEEQSCGCMWIELENMPKDTSNTFGTLGSLLFMYCIPFSWTPSMKLSMWSPPFFKTICVCYVILNGHQPMSQFTI